MGAIPQIRKSDTHERGRQYPFQINVSPSSMPRVPQTPYPPSRLDYFKGSAIMFRRFPGFSTESFSFLNFQPCATIIFGTKICIYTLKFNMKTLIYFFPSTYHARSPFYSTDNAMWNNVDADIYIHTPNPEGDLKWDLSHSAKGGNIPRFREKPAKELG